MQNITDDPAAIHPVYLLFDVSGYDDLQNSTWPNQVPNRAVLPPTRFHFGSDPRAKSGGQGVPVSVPRAPLELLVSLYEGAESFHQCHFAERWVNVFTLILRDRYK